MKQEKVLITTDDGKRVEASAPVIVSASRSTDIPAFFAQWFFERLRRGYVKWINPYNQRPQYVSFANMRFIVFWSKNPAPLLPFLPILREMGIGCYVHYTLNDYEAEGLEPQVPPLASRIDTFYQLRDSLGPGSVVWRFDPLILTDQIDIDSLLGKIAGLAEKLKGYAEQLVFSFADIGTYARVGNHLTKAGINYREWTPADMISLAKGLQNLHLEMRLSTCAEYVDLHNFGIRHNRCIDPELMTRLRPFDTLLHNHLFGSKRDKGQRALCQCVVSKDIGQYCTCTYGCLYCYANSSVQKALVNYQRHIANPHHDSIL